MPRNYEQILFNYMDQAVRYMKIQPVLLGGTAGSGGGIGGPPGGFVGFLPQTRVAYDYSEAATLSNNPSGISLVDNLNHMRFRIGTLEALTSGGVDILEEGVTILNNASAINFVDVFDVSISDVGEVTVGALASGTRSDTTYSGVYGEEFSLTASGVQQFTVINDFDPSSLSVYWNGQRLSNSDVNVIDTNTFEVNLPVLISGDIISADYQVPHVGYFHNHHQYAASGDVYTKSQVNELLDDKADLIHTHVEADITDLSHDAVSIQGVPVLSGIAPTDYQILQFSTYDGAFKIVTAEFEQQILFPFGNSDLNTTGVKPLRVYLHDIGSNALLTEIFVYAGTAPAGGSLAFDIQNNGLAVASLALTAGSNTVSTTSFYNPVIAKDDYLELNVTTANAVVDYFVAHIRFKRRFE